MLKISQSVHQEVVVLDALLTVPKPIRSPGRLKEIFHYFKYNFNFFTHRDPWASSIFDLFLLFSKFKNQRIWFTLNLRLFVFSQRKSCASSIDGKSWLLQCSAAKQEGRGRWRAEHLELRWLISLDSSDGWQAGDRDQGTGAQALEFPEFLISCYEFL